MRLSEERVSTRICVCVRIKKQDDNVESMLIAMPREYRNLRDGYILHFQTFQSKANRGCKLHDCAPNWEKNNDLYCSKQTGRNKLMNYMDAE